MTSPATSPNQTTSTAPRTCDGCGDPEDEYTVLEHDHRGFYSFCSGCARRYEMQEAS